MTRTTEVEGKPWRDGDVGVDEAGKLWQLRFVPSSWGPALDRWVWLEFGSAAEQPVEALAPTRVWPLDGGIVPPGETVTLQAGETVEAPKRRRSS